MTPTRIDVGASGGRQYPILLGAGLAERLTDTLNGLGVGRRRVVITTPTVWRFVSDRFADIAREREPIRMPDGERYKTLKTVERLYAGLQAAGADRNTVVLAIGGGVAGDTAGFAAATFLRGLPVVQVPTTLLAQVDSAIGGKVGVNLASGKNLVGAFHPPAAVVADPVLLSTLPRREFRAGLYEVVKYAVIANGDLFRQLETSLKPIFAREPQALEPVLAECCRIKARVVTEDEHEHGIRRTLNFGHTAGHALEAITHYRRFRHGEAVGYGMLAAADLARRRGVLPSADYDRLRVLMENMGSLPPVTDLPADEAIAATRRDKKVLDGRLHYVLPTCIGDTTIVTDVTEDELRTALVSIGLKG